MNSHPLPSPEAIPEPMRESARWCNYKRVEKADGKVGKEPHGRNGDMRVLNRPNLWMPLIEALENPMDGIGFIAGGGFVCLDMDACISEFGGLDGIAQKMVARFRTYAEKSPSGRGIHIWMRGTLPGPEDGKVQFCVGTQKFEFLAERHYATFTGIRVSGSPAELRDCTDTLAEVIAEYRPPAEPLPVQPTDTGSTYRWGTNAQLFERIRKSLIGPSFDLFWAGRWDDILVESGSPDADGNQPMSQRYASQSEADMAFLQILRMWCGENLGWVIEVFKESGMFRPDKGRGGDDYVIRSWERLSRTKPPLDFTREPSLVHTGAPIQLPDDASQSNMELIYADALTASIGPVRTVGTTWFCYERGCWVEHKDGSIFGRQAFDILPRKYQKHAGARSLLSHIELKSKVSEDLLIGAYQFDAQGRVLLNTKDAVLRVCKDRIEQLPTTQPTGSPGRRWPDTTPPPRHRAMPGCWMNCCRTRKTGGSSGSAWETRSCRIAVTRSSAAFSGKAAAARARSWSQSAQPSAQGWSQQYPSPDCAGCQPSNYHNLGGPA